jgi:chromodomain-helicase-DNA-binding protein 6
LYRYVQAYNSAAYILPVGYRTSRQYMRCDDPDGPRTRWVQEIIEGDGGVGPMFRLSPDEGLSEPIVAKSATAAWAEVLRRVTAFRAAKGEEAKKTAISGPEFFGYSLPHVRLLIEELPGAAACVDYRPLRDRTTAPAQGEESVAPVEVKEPVAS